MSAKQRRTARDRRRRQLGQNFLVDRRAVDRIVREAAIEHDQLVVEIGAGTGALTVALARAGALVTAIEPDPVWAARLRIALAGAAMSDRVQVVEAGFSAVAWPDGAYRVVANPPFNRTTALLAALLDDPDRGPWRADLLVQREVARKHATVPPATLRTAAWAPWWSFEERLAIGRGAFRPVPEVDASLLTVQRRHPPVLPSWLAPRLRELLRAGWAPPAGLRRGG